MIIYPTVGEPVPTRRAYKLVEYSDQRRTNYENCLLGTNFKAIRASAN